MEGNYTYTGNDTDSVTTSGTDNFITSATWYVYNEPKKEENMRGLYRITVVNPKTEEAWEHGLVVAKDEETAKLKAVRGGAIKAGDVEDYDILAECVGDVRAKKDIQKVEVVEGDK